MDQVFLKHIKKATPILYYFTTSCCTMIIKWLVVSSQQTKKAKEKYKTKKKKDATSRHIFYFTSVSTYNPIKTKKASPRGPTLLMPSTLSGTTQ